MKQIIVLKKGIERYLRHQHAPQIDTSHSKLIRMVFDGSTVYVFPRSGLNCKLNGRNWAEQEVLTDGDLLEIEGVSIQIEIR